MSPIRSMALAATLFATGCGFTTEGEVVRQAVKTEGARAYDEGLVNAEWFLCKAASVGAVLRRYGQSEHLMDAWRALCVEAPGAAALLRPTEVEALGRAVGADGAAEP